jgi:hypothetical protein
MMTIEGGPDAEVFEAFLQHVLIPKLRPCNIVILDNVGAHKPEQMRKHIAQAGASMIFLPAYSPDINPIEFCWSKLRAGLKDFVPICRGMGPGRCRSIPPRGPHRRDDVYLPFFSVLCPAFWPGLSLERYDSPSMTRS